MTFPSLLKIPTLKRELAGGLRWTTSSSSCRLESAALLHPGLLFKPDTQKLFCTQVTAVVDPES